MSNPLGDYAEAERAIDGVRKFREAKGTIDALRKFQEEVIKIQALRTRTEEALSAAHQPETMNSSRPLLIGIGGKLAAGKDTLADHLVAAHGFAKHGMSEPLATALYTLNPWVGERYDEEGYNPGQIRYREVVDDIGYTMAEKIPEVRRLLQVLGTEVGRDQLGAGTWTGIARRHIAEARDAGVPVILTGIRYGNERDMIQEEGGTLVWIERPEPNLLEFGNPSSTANSRNIGQAVVHAIDDALDPELAQHHSSEVSLTSSDFDLTITNDGSIRELHAKADELITRLQV